MVEHQLPKLRRRVRFPLPAFKNLGFMRVSRLEYLKGNQKGNRVVFISPSILEFRSKLPFYFLKFYDFCDNDSLYIRYLYVPFVL